MHEIFTSAQLCRDSYDLEAAGTQYMNFKAFKEDFSLNQQVHTSRSKGTRGKREKL